MIFDGKPTIIGHRGMGAGVVAGVAENTIASFLSAIAAGATWIELDVTRTADDEIVVYHDPVAPNGRPVVAQTARELGLPLFRDVLETLPTSIGLDVDVKTIMQDVADPAHRRTGALLAPIVAAERKRRQLVVASFDPGLLLGFKADQPGLATALLTSESLPIWHAIPAAASMGIPAVGIYAASFWPSVFAPGPHHPKVDESIKFAHGAGLEVMAWCPRPREIPALVKAGVDALCVDNVTEVMRALPARV